MKNIIDDKVENVIDIIKNMDLKNKLRLGVCNSSSAYTNLKYNKAHIINYGKVRILTTKKKHNFYTFSNSNIHLNLSNIFIK